MENLGYNTKLIVIHYICSESINEICDIVYEVKDMKKEPTVEQIEYWMLEGICEMMDCYLAEADGYYEHGCPSWVIAMGVV